MAGEAQHLLISSSEIHDSCCILLLYTLSENMILCHLKEHNLTSTGVSVASADADVDVVEESDNVKSVKEFIASSIVEAWNRESYCRHSFVPGIK